MKRNIINEITSVKSRAEFNSRFDFSTRLNDIELALKESLNYNVDFDKELVKYIPIATVACFEAFFRSVYRELVDFGKPFSDNAVKFNQSKNVKFDFEIVNAIQTKILTVGDFISHILPCNNLDDINSNMSTLAGIDFLENLKNNNAFIEEMYSGDNSKQFIDNSEQIIIDIKRIFELRHIFCHEFATNFKIDKNEISSCFYSAKIFLNHVDNFVYNLLYPNAPISQWDMNEEASGNFDVVDKKLNELIELIKVASKQYYPYEPIDDKKFDKLINEWKKYRKVKALYDASYVEGGSMYPLIYLSSMTTTTEEKIESLETEFEIALKKYACQINS